MKIWAWFGLWIGLFCGGACRTAFAFQILDKVGCYRVTGTVQMLRGNIFCLLTEAGSRSETTYQVLTDSTPTYLQNGDFISMSVFIAQPSSSRKISSLSVKVTDIEIAKRLSPTFQLAWHFERPAQAPSECR